ncbi:MAG: acyltransferase [Brevundimonas sp.]|jgi:acetyltransferase-like isoleucine patch superfamily enzyme|uniref:acyltransferase n=1 Tax=Brevundimonas sp. TaxID=1871086 RepID=UPI00391C0445
MAGAATARPGLSVSGEGHTIDIASDVDLSAGIDIAGRGNTLVIGPGVSLSTAPGGRHPALRIVGEGQHIRLGAGGRLSLQASVEGTGARLELGERVIATAFINLLGTHTDLTVGAGTTMVQAAIQLHEPGHIRIGRDCMISSQVYISLSDIHPIYDLATGERINPAASVEIGDHVWLGLRSMVMKGSRIGDGSVVAAGALVSGEVEPACIVGGTPARVLRRGVVWRRDFDEAPPEPVILPAAATSRLDGLLARLWRRARR